MLCALWVCSSTARAGTVVVAYDAADCTANLQAALNNPSADTIVVPKIVVSNLSLPWKTGPLVLARSNVTIRIEPGVELVAKNGAYPVGSCLLQIQLCQNVTIHGYGATFRMLNGTDHSYDTEENRHCIGLRAVNNVVVEGVKCTKAGGDGIYVSDGWGGSDPTYSSNVTIQDCTLDNNRRQGISVISAQDLIIRRCVMSNTGATNGTAPKAGIDFEPDLPVHRLVRCALQDCSMFGNRAGDNYGSGIHTYLGNLNGTSQPVAISIERCLIKSTAGIGFGVKLNGTSDGGPPTTFTMSDCLIEDTRSCGLYLNSSAATTTTQINRTVLRNTFTDTVSWGGTPIYLEGQFEDVAAYGNITFTDCLVVDSKARPFIRSYEDRSFFSPSRPDSFCDGLRGNITVINPNAGGRTFNLDFTNDLNTTLAVTGLAAMPVQTVGVSASTAATSAGSATPATLAVTRIGSDVSFTYAVDVTRSGTATNGNDYAYQPGFVIIPPNTGTVSISLAARADGVISGEKTAIITLIPRSGDPLISPGAGTSTLHIFDTPLPAWRFNTFGDSSDSGDGADAANPAGDGMVNLLKYAFGGNPAVADAASISPSPSVNSGQLQFSFRCDSAHTDITYNVQASDELATWTDIASSIGGAMTNPINGSGALISDSGSGLRTVTVTDLQQSALGGSRFLRLKVELNTP